MAVYQQLFDLKTAIKNCQRVGSGDIILKSLMWGLISITMIET